MTRPVYAWPDLIGGRNKQGDLCIAMHKSRSKGSRTRCEFLSPRDGSRYKTLAPEVMWDADPNTHAILREGLRQIVNQKVEVPFDRGSVATRLCFGSGGPRLYLFEVFRDTLWPRYWWRMPIVEKYARSLKWAIWMETLTDQLVAIPDTRRPVELEWHTPSEEPYTYFDWDMKDYVSRLLASRAREQERAS